MKLARAQYYSQQPQLSCVRVVQWTIYGDLVSHNTTSTSEGYRVTSLKFVFHTAVSRVFEARWRMCWSFLSQKSRANGCIASKRTARGVAPKIGRSLVDDNFFYTPFMSHFFNTRRPDSVVDDLKMLKFVFHTALSRVFEALDDESAEDFWVENLVQKSYWFEEDTSQRGSAKNRKKFGRRWSFFTPLLPLFFNTRRPDSVVDDFKMPVDVKTKRLGCFLRSLEVEPFRAILNNADRHNLLYVVVATTK